MGKILVLVADDIGIESLSLTSAEAGISSTYKPRTPNLDALAAAGVRFRRCYVNPSCSPTRALLNTGRYGFRTGVFNNATGSAGPPGAGEAWIAKALDATHTCANIGKWHLFSGDNGLLTSPLKPGSSGVAHYDRWQGVFGNITGGTTYWHWPRWRDGVLYDLSEAAANIGAADGASNRVATNYATTITVDDAIAWIGAQGGDWLCVVNFNAAHEPLHQPPTLAERESAGYGMGSRLMSATMETVTQAYIDILNEVDIAANQAVLDGLGWPNDLETEVTPYASLSVHIAMIEAMDTEIGRLLADENVDIAENADVTVWYLTDNGATDNIVDALLPGQSGKNTVKDLGTRSPCIVAGNGVTATAGSVSERLISPVDIWRTILQAESINVATAFPGLTLDGLDMAALLADPKAAGPRTYAYTERATTYTAGLPDGGIADIETGATNDSEHPQLQVWDRAVHSETYTLIQSNAYTETGERTVTWELYGYLGGDRLNGENLLLDQALTFDSVGRDTADWRALNALRTALANLEP